MTNYDSVKRYADKMKNKGYRRLNAYIPADLYGDVVTYLRELRKRHEYKAYLSDK